jgi:hypothetical protein
MAPEFPGCKAERSRASGVAPGPVTIKSSADVSEFVDRRYAVPKLREVTAPASMIAEKERRSESLNLN